MADTPLPNGWPVQLDRRLRVHGSTLLTSTGRLLRLGAKGQQALADAQLGTGSRVFARRLVAAGAAHPLPPAAERPDVTVVVPVRDRADELDRCLALAGGDVVVVDDGSADLVAVQAVCDHHGARLVAQDHAGPGAARNAALLHLSSELVAFLDSDCLPSVGWLRELCGHFDDPTLVAVAPRLVGGLRSPVDLGPHPDVVGAGIGFVPSGCLVVRREALDALVRDDGHAFDPSLTTGEDVDLVRRLRAHGTVRYDPRVQVEHAEPTTQRAWLARWYRYGRGVASLDSPAAHVIVPPWPSAAVAALVLGKPVVAAAIAGRQAQLAHRGLKDPKLTARVVADHVTGTAVGLGQALSLLGPLAWLMAVRRPRVALLLALPFLREWRDRGGASPAAYVGRGLLDQAAYGAGLIAGCARERNWAAVRPRTRR